MPRVIATTDRLTVRELTVDDAGPLYEILGDPIAMEHYPAPKTRLETEAWIGWARDSYERNGFGLWAVERTADGAFIGDCGPMLQPVDGELVPEVGYHVVRREWGRGYATEAAMACRDLVLGRFGFDRVVSIVAPENLASRRVAEKVHQTMREFVWEKSGRAMCMYETLRAPAR
jgi:RimJ/RimL family protein N-acetyltransferase